MPDGGDAASSIRRAIERLDEVLKRNNPLPKQERNRVITCKDALVETLYELETYGDLDIDTQEHAENLLYEVAEILEKYH